MGSLLQRACAPSLGIYVRATPVSHHTGFGLCVMLRQDRVDRWPCQMSEMRWRVNQKDGHVALGWDQCGPILDLVAVATDRFVDRRGLQLSIRLSKGPYVATG